MMGDPSREFTGKSVLVTGGARGIGLAIAQGFREEGALVSVIGTKPRSSYAADLSQFDFHQIDATDEAAAQRLAAATTRLDVLVNNAGIALYKKQEFGISDFRRVLDVNLISAMIWSTCFHEALKSASGTIINISSLAGQMGARGNPAYAASKGGLDALTKSLALAWGRDGIRVNAIAPGFVQTEMTIPSHKDRAIREAVEKRTPLGRWGRTEEIANVAVTLASARASFLTGTVVVADGGYRLVL